MLDREELQKFLIQAQADGYYELFLLDLCTGLRRGEMCIRDSRDAHVGLAVVHGVDAAFDLVGDVRNDLHRSAKVAALSLIHIFLAAAVILVLTLLVYLCRL